MESILIYVLFAVGIVLIVKGGDWFVDGAVWAAEITRIPKFIIGATIISVATTLPEIFVSTIAAMEGHGILVSQVGDYIAASQDKVGMAIGNGIGSVICNTAMILAISIIFMPIAVDKRSFAPKGILLIAAVCALFLLSRSGSFSIAGAAVLLFIFLLYITENIRSAKRDAGAEETEEAPASDVPHPRLAAGVPVGAARLGAQGHGLAGGIVVVAHRPGGANIPAVVVGEHRACPGGVPVVLGQSVPLGDGGRVRVPDRVLGGAAGPRAGRQQQEQRKKAWYEAFHWIVPPRWNCNFCPPITQYVRQTGGFCCKSTG